VARFDLHRLTAEHISVLPCRSALEITDATLGVGISEGSRHPLGQTGTEPDTGTLVIDRANCDTRPAGAVWTDKKGMTAMQRKDRTRNEEPRMMPRPVDDVNDVVAVDTTWGRLQPLEAGYPAETLAYYRGGMHDWITLSMPTESTDD